MLAGFIHHSDGRSEPITSLDALDSIRSDAEAAVWIDLTSPPPEEMQAVAARFNLDPEAVDDCLTGEQRPRVDEFDDAIFIVVYGAVGAEAADVFDPRKLAAFLGTRYLITVHHESLRTIATATSRCTRFPAQLIGRGPDFVLYTLLDGIVDNYIRVAELYEDRLEAIEDSALTHDPEDEIPARLAELRRELLSLRRIAASQLELLWPLERGEFPFVAGPLERRFAHVEDHLTHVIELVDSLRDRIDGVHEIYHATLATRMNNIMKTLTLFATILLPLTFIAGIYGMNLPFWPPPENPQSFWIVLGMMLGIAVAVFIYFRRRRWI